VTSPTAERYLRFAEVEARGLSPRYEEWARGVAADPEVVALIDRVPDAKRQVNLVFGAARFHGAPDAPWPAARDWIVAHWNLLEPTILERATQTNEAARCATLLPALDRVEGPVALLEVGTSAGLCLFPDRYSYEYRDADGAHSRHPSDGPSTVVLPCDLDGVAVPRAVPEVVWRAGIDLNPLDVSSADDRAWLHALIWPEHDDRRARLHAAAEIARRDPPLLVRGDALVELPEVAAAAPAEATLVVFHSAVLMYLSAEGRARFADTVRAIAAGRRTVWISNESPSLLPGTAASLPPRPDQQAVFALAVDGEAVALTHPHGRWVRGLGTSSSR